MRTWNDAHACRNVAEPQRGQLLPARLSWLSLQISARVQLNIVVRARVHAVVPWDWTVRGSPSPRPLLAGCTQPGVHKLWGSKQTMPYEIPEFAVPF